LEAIEMVFLALFVGEILLKMVGFGWLYWNDNWNTIDFIIIFLAVIEVILTAAGESSENTGISALRIIRIFRLFRIVGRLERLNLLVQAFIFSLYSVVWVGVLMLLLLYIFGVIATNCFKADLMERVKANGSATVDATTWWSTVPMSMATLLQVMTMDSWSSQIGRPIGQEAPWAWGFIIFFLVIVGLGFLNLLSAIFVDSLLEMNKSGLASEREARQAAQVKAMENIARLFAMIDADGSGTIDKEELDIAVEKLKKPEWKGVLSELGVQPESLEVLLREFNDGMGNDNEEDDLFYDDFIDMFVHLDEGATKKEVYKIEKLIIRAKKETESKVDSCLRLLGKSNMRMNEMQVEMRQQRMLLLKLLGEENPAALNY